MSVKNKQKDQCSSWKRLIATSCAGTKKARYSDKVSSVTIFNVLNIDICCRAILNLLPLADLLRSECVCKQWRDVIIHYIHGTRRIGLHLHIITPFHQSMGYLADEGYRRRALPLDESSASYAVSLYKWGKYVEAAPCTADSMLVVFRHCPNLQELTLYGVPDSDTVKEHLEDIRKLRRLGFCGLQTRSGTSGQITDHNIGIFLKNDTLEALKLVNLKLTGACLNELSTNLTCIRIQDCPALDLILLKTALNKLRAINTLELSGLSTKILQNIHMLVDELDNLERLELCRYEKTQLSDLQVFERLKRLKHLILKSNQAVDNCWLRAVAAALSLETLDISHCQGLDVTAIEQVCRASTRSMRILNVAGMSHLTNEVINPLIRLCPNLCVLNVQECNELSWPLVPGMARLMRRRRYRNLPEIHLLLYGTNMPDCVVEKKFMRGKNLILDFTKDSPVPDTFRPDQILTHQYPVGLMQPEIRLLIATSCAGTKKARYSDKVSSVTIFNVLNIDICCRAILNLLPLADLLRSECVCKQWRDIIIHYIHGTRRIGLHLHIITPFHQSMGYLADEGYRRRALPLDESSASYAVSLYKWGKYVEAAPCTADSMLVVFRHCPNLQELTLYGVPDSDTVKEHLEDIRKLRRLGFCDLQTRSGTSGQITDHNIGIFLKNDTLEALKLVNLKLTGACLNGLSTNLTCIRIQDCPALDPVLLKTVLNKLKAIKTLELSGLSTKILQNIHMLIDKLDNLERLELCRYEKTQLPDSQVFERLKRLKHLILKSNQAVDDRWLRAVAAALSLETLDISHCHGLDVPAIEGVCRASTRSMMILGVAGMSHLTNEDIQTLIRLCPYLCVLNAQECDGLSWHLVLCLARLMRRRRRHNLPVLRLMLYGTHMPDCMVEKEFMRGRNLFLDFTKDSPIPDTFRPDQILTHQFPVGLMSPDTRL